MIKTNSIYTLNKKDPNAIVYNTSFGAACPERTAKNTKRDVYKRQEVHKYDPDFQTVF